jgi:hypothetical protein
MKRTALLAALFAAIALPSFGGGASATATVSARIIRPVMLQVANAAAINLTGVDFKRGYVDLGDLRVGERGGVASYQFAASVAGSATGVTLARPEGLATNPRLPIASSPVEGSGITTASRVLYLTCNNY